jgi:anthranilate synthase/aminodeoxychorismate synthase-like glutamine amidotransferase
VVRHDEATAAELVARRADGYAISAGPCTPRQAGASLALVERMRRELPDTPLLGLCLGHQAIAMAAGAQLRRAATPMHGKITPVRHDGSGLFDGLDSPLPVVRYNSLVVDETTLPPHLSPTAWSDDGDIMALRDTTRPHEGLQFHPESWMCPEAAALLAAWVERTWLARVTSVGHAPER